MKGIRSEAVQHARRRDPGGIEGSSIRAEDEEPAGQKCKNWRNCLKLNKWDLIMKSVDPAVHRSVSDFKLLLFRAFLIIRRFTSLCQTTTLRDGRATSWYFRAFDYSAFDKSVPDYNPSGR